MCRYPLTLALLCLPLLAHAAREPQAQDYSLSMAGALINDWCERNWEAGSYISIHACNYLLANRYGIERSGTDFSDCAVATGGDLIAIADCLRQRFDAWVAEAGNLEPPAQ